MIALILVAAGVSAGIVVIALALGLKLNVAPYSGRRQLIWQHSFNVAADVSYFEKNKNRCYIIPKWHCFSTRAKRIADRILQAMEKGLEEEGSGSSAKQFFKELEWEVVVAVDPDIEIPACFVGGGKIMISVALFLLFWRDDEIATFIGREVAFCIGRHVPELQASLFLMIILGFISLVSMPFMFSVCFIPFAYFALWQPFCKRLVKEADYVGLLLMARAGFNPEVAPRVLKDLNIQHKGWERYLFLYPTGQERAEMVSQDHVMAQAKALYEKNKPPGSWSSKICKLFTGCFNG